MDAVAQKELSVQVVKEAAGLGKTGLLLPAFVIALLFFIGDFAVFHLLKSGMDRYYGLVEPARILCVGHSHTVLGIDAQRMENELGVPVAKYATAGANTLDRLWMIRHFLERQPSVKTVIYDVDPRLFDTEGLSSASYTLFLPYIDEPLMGRYLRQEAIWQEYAAAYWIRTTRFRDQTINIALRGLWGRIENKKGSRMRVENVQGFIDREKERKVRINPKSVNCFRETIDFLTGKKIEVVLVFLPVADLLNQTDPEGMDAAMAIFQDLARSHPKVHFIDYNRDYEHRHELFYDPRHLNAEGNRIVTRRLIDDLRRLFLVGS